jgi:hypothetical protein
MDKDTQIRLLLELLDFKDEKLSHMSTLKRRFEQQSTSLSESVKREWELLNKLRELENI